VFLDDYIGLGVLFSNIVMVNVQWEE